MRFVEDAVSLETEISLGNLPWGLARGCSGSGLFFFPGEEGGGVSHVKGYARLQIKQCLFSAEKDHGEDLQALAKKHSPSSIKRCTNPPAKSCGKCT